ncbi:hypothetical protein [Curtobacterium ammoniigenes]|uniref:hypothetical protein n=1 Tax=Curtobacterium ammoniigenes TaxID=395387 RepID=UPI00082C6ED8|nr:hypothetical protein [Curtobacterium ammoniigenes]
MPHVGLRIELDAPVETVRDALADPRVMVAVTTPLLMYRSRAATGFPRRWTDGEPHPITARVFGVLPAGDSHVNINRFTLHGVPVQRDNGGGTSGVFGRMDMQHRMAASPLPGGRTLLRDRLDYSMSPRLLAYAMWPGLWVTWQWRAARMRALAPTWGARDRTDER